MECGLNPSGGQHLPGVPALPLGVGWGGNGVQQKIKVDGKMGDFCANTESGSG